MGRVNYGRVILGGVVAGVIVDISESLVNALLLERQWADAMAKIGKSAVFGAAQIAAFNVWGLLVGLFAVWLYAAIRPRYGAGPRTALCAGLGTWFGVYLLSVLPSIAVDVFPASLMLTATAIGLAEMVIATQVGAYLYKETEEHAPELHSAAAGA